MNELYGFQLDSHRWYPLELRKDKPTKEKSKSSKKHDTSKASSLPANDINDDLDMSVENYGEDYMEDYEEAPDIQCGIKEVSNQVTNSLSLNNINSSKMSDVQGLNVIIDQQSSTSSEALKPCGRINSCMVVGRDTLYMYGGMMEVRDQEITLDDLYSLNLSKLDEWKCIIPASEPEWLEVSEEDDSEEEESDSEETDDDENDDMDSEGDGEGRLDMGDAVSFLKGEKTNLRRKEKRARIEQIRVTLGLSDSQRTPLPGELLRDFYKRTNTYWQMAAYEHTQHTGKELRKDGFDLAEARFRELKPILDELALLEAEQKAEEQEAEGSSSKRGNKKKQTSKSQR